MEIVLQKKLPFDVSLKKPLPAVRALEPSEWLIIDDAYSGQMAERVRLIENRRHEVLALDESAYAAADELLDLALGFLPNLPGFNQTKNQVNALIVVPLKLSQVTRSPRSARFFKMISV